MKATGIVRRIDDLGRVVIPKEIRRTLKIREGDSLEIYTDRSGEVIFKKYSPIGEMTSIAQAAADALFSVNDRNIIITDKDSIVASVGNCKKELLEKHISNHLENIINEKKVYNISETPGIKIPLADNNSKYFAALIVPIITQGDTIGSVCYITSTEDETVEENEIDMAKLTSMFLSNHIED